MTAPLPNCFSICWTARPRAESRAGSRGGGAGTRGAVDAAVEPLPPAGISLRTVCPRADTGVDDPGFAVDEDADAAVAADEVSASFTEDLATVGSFDASAGSLVQPAADRARQRLIG